MSYSNARPKNFEEMREILWEIKRDLAESLIERLDELNEFERGRYQGEYHMVDEIDQMLRGVLKYGTNDYEEVHEETEVYEHP